MKAVRGKGEEKGSRGSRLFAKAACGGEWKRLPSGHCCRDVVARPIPHGGQIKRYKGHKARFKVAADRLLLAPLQGGEGILVLGRGQMLRSPLLWPGSLRASKHRQLLRYAA